LPGVIMHRADGEEPPERHRHPVADPHGAGIDIGQLALEPAAALEVDDRGHDGWRERVREPVHRERRDRRRDVREPFGSHPVHGVALHAHALRRQMPGAARLRTWASKSPACAVPVLPMTAPRSSTTVPFVAPTTPASRRAARAWGPVTTQWLIDGAVTPARLSASVTALSPSGT